MTNFAPGEKNKTNGLLVKLKLIILYERIVTSISQFTGLVEF